MRFRLALPIAELMLIAILSGIVMTCWLGWQVVGPNDGPQAFASKQFQVVGDKLYQEGRHIGNWVPPADGKPGHWDAVPFVKPGAPPAD